MTQVLYNPVDVWIKTVQANHTKSALTEGQYRRHLSMFCVFAQKTPSEILKDYELMEEKLFKHKYSQLVKAWLASFPEDYAQGTTINMLAAAKSYFKYNDLPLGFMPSHIKVTYHNRPILKEEIQKILGQADPRERAFFSFMAQSGLRPDTICKLKVKDLESLDKIPCRVTVDEENTKGAYSKYFTFIGEDTVSYLKAYWNTRGALAPDSFLFAAKDGKSPLHRSVPSHKFASIADRLRKTHALEFEKKKRSPIRLYVLRKYFRDKAGNANGDFANFWMGHKLPQSSDQHYFPGAGTDITPEIIERHRQVYAEKALPHLRLESATPSETDKMVQELSKKNEEMKEKMAALAYLLVETKPEAEKEVFRKRVFDVLGIEPDKKIEDGMKELHERAEMWKESREDKKRRLKSGELKVKD
jgi:integrase